MTKRKSTTVNHSDQPVEVTVPKAAGLTAEDVMKNGERFAEAQGISADEVAQGFASKPAEDEAIIPMNTVPLVATANNEVHLVVQSDTVDAWNELFFAIKALKANPSEALKASKMGRLLEKLP